ncbi:di-heme oxidoredictase family protein [Nannocystaceae bacterium ST9]
MTTRLLRSSLPFTLILVGCPESEPEPKLAEGIYAPLGEIRPNATAAQREAFERGREIATRRITPELGLGPLFNVSFCAACHEKPTIGGGAPRYRDFFLTGNQLDDGSFLPSPHGGVLTAYGIAGAPTRPTYPADVDTIAHRNAIPFFGVGLLAELDEAAILANADPDDADGDGISGRPNYDRGFVGRFGRKSQTVSIEGFIRGPLNNHLGLTSDPLTDEQKAALPVPSAAPKAEERVGEAGSIFRQAAAPEEPLTDGDEVPDPELAGEDLFDLVSFAMLLAAPEPEPPTERSEAGRSHFEAVGCADCHVATLEGPRGLIPLYSDLLLHDMGPALADGIAQGLASGSEFRTQPLWGIAAESHYLHDGRADTLDAAIRWHAGEGEASRVAYEALSADERDALIEFLLSLGGREQASEGLLPPDAPVPTSGEPGCPRPEIHDDPDRLAQWIEGRRLFDRNVPVDAGLGPTFNGDSCRACHFDPIIGGASPVDLDVMRYGTIDAMGEFVAPATGTILHKLAIPGHARPEASDEFNQFERRQTPSLLGLGLIETIADDDILALQDPDDLDGDGIRGVAHVLPDGRLGRFGWKAQVPSLREFARDALGAELGLTSPVEDGFSFGAFADDDEVADPELTSATIDAIAAFIAGLDAPPPGDELPGGLELFEQVGCDGCHVPELSGASGPVAAYSDLLLHDVALEGSHGIVDGSAGQTMFRTPPLWGVVDTPPYMHEGNATTLDAAILAHHGEADAVRVAYEALADDERALLIAFLEAL